MLDQPVTHAQGDLVVVQILVAPMCTEFKHRRSGSKQLALGHEAAGVVVDAGSSGRVRKDDRVAVMPHYVCVQCWLCTPGDYMYCKNRRDVLAETGQDYGTNATGSASSTPIWGIRPTCAARWCLPRGR